MMINKDALTEICKRQNQNEQEMIKLYSILYDISELTSSVVSWEIDYNWRKYVEVQ
jgi:hypothetical protein